jgi:hypothetical protein
VRRVRLRERPKHERKRLRLLMKISAVTRRLLSPRHSLAVGYFLGVGFALLVFAPYALYSLAPAPTLTVSNHSPAVLKKIVLRGSGFSENIAQLSPHSRKSLRVYPDGKSNLSVAFTTPVRHIVLVDLLSYEFSRFGGYKVFVIIDESYGVRVNTGSFWGHTIGRRHETNRMSKR